MAQALRLGKEYHGRQTPLERETRRRIMWTCFIVDRLLALVSSRRYAIPRDSLTIQLPCPEDAFLFEEAMPGPTLHDFSAEVGTRNLLAQTVKSIEAWGEMAHHFATGTRLTSVTSALDRENEFYQSEQLTKGLIMALPRRLKWSLQNYATHRALGVGCLFATHLFILNQAACLAHQDYLPQIGQDSLLRVAEEPTAHQASAMPSTRLSQTDEYMISTCLFHAEEIRSIAIHMFGGDQVDRAYMRTPFCGVALVTAAGIFLWHAYFAEEQLAEFPDNGLQIPSSKMKVQQIAQMIDLWKDDWKIAQTWCETIELLNLVYAAAYKKPEIEFEHVNLATRDSSARRPHSEEPL
ncbi:uncharacterized protein PV06_10888 [Exophiala oligosperma]|uniref:Xylanolytic transcriptional activator regulatory domain-containing protein n=1 Tax=Exophiala oligosperma TaxID=215243 RepID=A0A0D2D3W6_9EURO|nr:uncharacterized protein PV06_10888 [Exophiala oligosperma]KIW36990.1 hypothetical protein PV06_10888 [Exophiala oligosperma]